MSEDNLPLEDDWRRQGQEKYLAEVTLVKRDYSTNNPESDHDHCEFCGTKFSLNGGYSTEDRYRWICTKCFVDFNPEFKWKVI